MFEFIIRGHFFVVNCQSTRLNTPFVLFCRMCSKLSGEDIQDPLTHPPSFGESGECEVVRIDFSETYEKRFCLALLLHKTCDCVT